MNKLYMIITATKDDTIVELIHQCKQTLLNEYYPKSSEYVYLTIYDDTNFDIIDMMVEDHTRRCNQYDGVMILDLTTLHYPTPSYLDEITDYINYYASTAKAILICSERIKEKIIDKLEYEVEVVDYDKSISKI